MKPFRLINASELQHLQTCFDKRLAIWNDNYALHPLSCKLSYNPDHLSTKSMSRSVEPTFRPHDLTALINHENQPIALCNQHDPCVIQQHVYGKNSTDFSDINETLFTSLLNQLFGTTSLQWRADANINDYLYTGSPGLALTIESTTLYLHPQWVINALPQQRTAAEPVHLLNDALATQALPLQVALNPIPLRLSQIMHLQVGDVIQTDHPLSMPLLLKHGKETLCNVDIGDNHQTKTIQITRTS